MLSWEPLKIMSYGGGTPSTALVLMACENRLAGRPIHPAVPDFDYVLFCDLHAEPVWVARQVAFVADTCAQVGIPFVTLDADLYGDFTRKFGKARVSSIPAWTIGPDGKKGKMPRQCTCDYKIKIMEQYVRYKLLGYRPRQRTKWWDVHTHEMHMGIMAEERCRAKPSRQTLFENKYPLVEMGWTRADCFRYNKETWGIETWASSCVFCPFHTRFFFHYLREHDSIGYAQALRVDELLERNQAVPPLTSSLFLTKTHKRLRELAEEECTAAQTFCCEEQPIWNGF